MSCRRREAVDEHMGLQTNFREGFRDKCTLVERTQHPHQRRVQNSVSRAQQNNCHSLLAGAIAQKQASSRVVKALDCRMEVRSV